MSAQPTGIRQQQAHNDTTHNNNRHTTGTRQQHYTRQQQAHNRHTTGTRQQPTQPTQPTRHTTTTGARQQQAHNNRRTKAAAARQQHHDRICSAFLKLCPIGGMDEQLCPHRGHGRTALPPSGAWKGREPKHYTTMQGQPWAVCRCKWGRVSSRSRTSHGQRANRMGMGGKQEQGQPWVESQFFGDGWQEQGQPWAECQFVGTEGKQGQGNRGISA